MTLRRAWTALSSGPTYPATEADRRTISIAGLDLPRRATAALVIVVLAVLVDYTRLVIPGDVRSLGLAEGGLRYQALERVLLFGLLPLAVITLAFRDRPANYGLRLGDWRWGLGLAGLGIAIMTPVVLGLETMPDFRAYYASSAAPLGDLVATNLLDIPASEFLFRGFLMFTLLRTIGPFGLIVAQVPFVFAHLGKPEIELFSTIFGGSVYGWVNWRTGSILWSALAHVYIVTLAVVAATG